MTLAHLNLEPDWETLLDLIADGEVVPIVGRDLVTVEERGVTLTLESVLAGRVARALGIREGEGESALSLDAIGGLILRSDPRRIGTLYRAVHDQLALMDPPVPPALRDLAQIAPLRLFLTTTFDSLLVRALRDARPHEHVDVRQFGLEGGSRLDLPEHVHSASAAVVYHLFGAASKTMDYAVTEEDTLEFAHKLQSPNRQPTRLLDELRGRSVLLLGSGFPDWLTRFILRLSRPGRFLHVSARPGLIADQRVRDDEPFARFVSNYSQDTFIHRLGAREFVAELSERWRVRASAATFASSPSAPVRNSSDPHAIFVSYASENREMARRVVEALTGEGLPVWFDTVELEPGEDYGRRIKDHIRRCPLFVPILSRQVLSESDPEGRGRWFREEWNEAIRRLPQFFGMTRPFIVPCAIDDIPLDSDGIPQEFRDTHVARVTGPDDLVVFANRVQELFRAYRVKQPRS